MFGNDFPIFLHFVLAILHDQFLSDFSNYPKIVLCSLTSRLLSVVFWVHCVFLVLYVCIVLVFRSKYGGSLHYLDCYISDLTMFSGFCE